MPAKAIAAAISTTTSIRSPRTTRPSSGTISGVSPQNTEPLTGDVMVNPIETRKVTRPGSSNPMTSGRQPTMRSRAFARVTSTISHKAMAASDSRNTTNSVTANSASANLLPGVADDHIRTAASMASVGRKLFGAVTMVSRQACATGS